MNIQLFTSLKAYLPCPRTCWVHTWNQSHLCTFPEQSSSSTSECYSVLLLAVRSQVEVVPSVGLSGRLKLLQICCTCQLFNIRNMFKYCKYFLLFLSVLYLFNFGLTLEKYLCAIPIFLSLSLSVLVFVSVFACVCIVCLSPAGLLTLISTSVLIS